MVHYDPKEEYANVIASTNHLEILCFVAGQPLAWLPKPTKSCSDYLYEGEQLNVYFQGPDGAEQGFLICIQQVNNTYIDMSPLPET